MDRDLWLTSSTPRALGAVLATQADVDDVLRAAAEAPRAGRRARARAERRQRKAEMEQRDARVAAEVLATAAPTSPDQG